VAHADIIASSCALASVRTLAEMPNKPASDLARLRWAKTTTEERSATMRAVAKHPRPSRKRLDIPVIRADNEK
jgi:hypothetical protein